MAKVSQDPEQSFMVTNLVQPLCEISLTTGTVEQKILVSLRGRPGERGQRLGRSPPSRALPLPLTASSPLPKHPTSAALKQAELCPASPQEGIQASWAPQVMPSNSASS